MQITGSNGVPHTILKIVEVIVKSFSPPHWIPPVPAWISFSGARYTLSPKSQPRPLFQ